MLYKSKKKKSLRNANLLVIIDDLYDPAQPHGGHLYSHPLCAVDPM